MRVIKPGGPDLDGSHKDDDEGMSDGEDQESKDGDMNEIRLQGEETSSIEEPQTLVRKKRAVSIFFNASFH